MPIKTDRRDAEGIARLPHMGRFRRLRCKSVSAPEVRAVPGARKAIRQGMIAPEMSLSRAVAHLRVQGRRHLSGQARTSQPRTGARQSGAGGRDRADASGAGSPAPEPGGVGATRKTTGSG